MHMWHDLLRTQSATLGAQSIGECKLGNPGQSGRSSCCCSLSAGMTLVAWWSGGTPESHGAFRFSLLPLKVSMLLGQRQFKQ
jgi:hypothetical protein